MKTTLLAVIAFVFEITCFGQEIELNSSLSTSSEQRFQGSPGIGLQYQHGISSKFQVGFGLQYNFKKSEFDHIPFIDADPTLIVAEKINSNSQRFSLRLNIQRLLKDNENVSVSVGPEISYNYVWGEDKIDQRLEQSPWHNIYSQKLGLANDIGLGLYSKIEIKKIIIPELSLSVGIRPEILIGKRMMVFGGEAPVFSGSIGFIECQIGLIYSFKKNCP